MPLKIVLFSFLALVVLLGCSKKALPVMTTPSASVELEEIDFKYLEGKGRINFRDQKGEKDVKTSIRIRKDSAIWMTFSMVGVQGGRALINKDSITIVSTLEKEYFSFSYTELSKRFNFNINYDVIQSAMLGNLIEDRSATDKANHESSFNILEQSQGFVNIKNYINVASKKIERVELTETNRNNSVSIRYSNFQPVQDKTFPYYGNINILYKTESGTINNTISFEYSKIEIGDKKLSFPFNIPRKYERR